MDVLDLLEQLRVRLNKSGIERTIGLKEAMTDDCFYYKKSLDIFMKNDYQEILNLFIKTAEQYESVEGKQWQQVINRKP